MKITATTRPRRVRVIVIGGGVAGLCMAQELAMRGFAVLVVEARYALGGKARSQPLLLTGADGRADLPGEHGFRFFPSFYRHLIDIMGKIPADPWKPEGRTVADNLVPCDQAAIARPGRGLRPFLRRRPRSIAELEQTRDLWLRDLEVSPEDLAAFSERLLAFLFSGNQRRLGEYDGISWRQFVRGGQYDPGFEALIAAVTRTMVAMDYRYGSALVLGVASGQLVFDYFQDHDRIDRTLNGPTTEAWIAPAKAELERLGVQFLLGAAVEEIAYDPRGHQITGIRIRGERQYRVGDFYAIAAPLEAAVRLATDEMAAFDLQMWKLREIDKQNKADATDPDPTGQKMLNWMTGIQFYLNCELPLVRGHVFYPDTPWALSSISQAQFWNAAGKGRLQDRYGNGQVAEILSVDVSDCSELGIVYAKPAYRCDDAEFAKEVWEQLKGSLNRPGAEVLRDDMFVGYHIDDDLPYENGRRHNRSPLHTHAPGTYRLRPTAATSIENLVLAGDYVQNSVRLASMEGAAETARRGVNVILCRSGYRGAPCSVWELREPLAIEVIKAIDDVMYTVGRGWQSIRESVGARPGLAEFFQRVSW